ncbi:hypothetical protein [Acidithiobacillus sulfuriphilus]|uniref:Uncharacterized protein n=1 Tax=Acidithiobacillus sulfuriphilus TaxID=1867749 RepID=A0ACD5HRM6_9PROT|nr:hypothetical protein [Acidithiobacillus sulfuriphilus]
MNQQAIRWDVDRTLAATEDAHQLAFNPAFASAGGRHLNHAFA